MLLLNGFSSLNESWIELEGAPDLSIVRDTIQILRQHKIEGAIDVVYFGGVRSGTDVAKLIAMGCTAVIIAMPIGMAVGGKISNKTLQFSSDYTHEDRVSGVVNILKSCESEASMMARCTGKTKLESLEPEDLRSITLATSSATGVLLAGKQ
jgi:isopentenyl diphosphate isomerase/L-lactate dehydrogenase-like FMN-dependent dehydrogenase